MANKYKPVHPSSVLGCTLAAAGVMFNIFRKLDLEGASGADLVSVTLSALLVAGVLAEVNIIYNNLYKRLLGHEMEQASNEYGSSISSSRVVSSRWIILIFSLLGIFYIAIIALLYYGK